MQSWLKLVGSADKPITDSPFYGNYREEYIGFRKNNVPGIRSGDHLFLYAPGGSRRIFALVEAITDPERDSKYNPNEQGSCRWLIYVRYLMNLPVASGVLIDEANSERRDLVLSIRRQSHIKLLFDEYEQIYKKLEVAAGGTTENGI